jgi:hypothetical protein
MVPPSRSRAWAPAAAFLFFLVWFTSGCSSFSFNRDWKRTVSQPVAAGDIAGPWEGEWKSRKNGHHGRLCCLLIRRSEGMYFARFHAVYWKVFRYTSSVVLQAREEPQRVAFDGEADLGWWAGGNYRYEGYASETNFFATYRSKYDHGTFSMRRPGSVVDHP